MTADYTPEAIAGREKTRASIDGRRMIATAAAGAVVSIAIFALGGAMLNALFSAEETPAEIAERLGPRVQPAAGQSAAPRLATAAEPVADADWAAALATAGGNLDALSEAEFDAMVAEEEVATPTADRAEALLLHGTGADWAAAGVIERSLVLEAWAFELAMTSERPESLESLHNARQTMAPIGMCMDAATAPGGLPEAQTMPLRDIAASCGGAYALTLPIEP